MTNLRTMCVLAGGLLLIGCGDKQETVFGAGGAKSEGENTPNESTNDNSVHVNVALAGDVMAAVIRSSSTISFRLPAPSPGHRWEASSSRSMPIRPDDSTADSFTAAPMSEPGIDSRMHEVRFIQRPGDGWLPGTTDDGTPQAGPPLTKVYVFVSSKGELGSGRLLEAGAWEGRNVPAQVGDVVVTQGLHSANYQCPQVIDDPQGRICEAPIVHKGSEGNNDLFYFQIESSQMGNEALELWLEGEGGSPLIVTVDKIDCVPPTTKINCEVRGGRQLNKYDCELEPCRLDEGKQCTGMGTECKGDLGCCPSSVFEENVYSCMAMDTISSNSGNYRMCPGVR